MRLRLKARARALATEQGHALGAFAPTGPGSPMRIARCGCGAYVRVDTVDGAIRGSAIEAPCAAARPEAETARLIEIRRELTDIDGRLLTEA